MNTEPNLLWHALNQTKGIGSRTIGKLTRVFASPTDIVDANQEKLTQTFLTTKTLRAIQKAVPELNHTLAQSTLEKHHVHLVSIRDDSYPTLLKEIHDPPPLLYYQGNIETLTLKPTIAIVGTRKPTSYGKEATKAISEELSHAGVNVVSGLALGLDSVAHRAVLAVNGCTTAVIGSGLARHVLAPGSHIRLADEIIKNNGVLVSEYAPDTPAGAGTFPARNRIIAGLSLGTVVVEAAEKSGTLITSGLALEYNRDVFAIPGSIFSTMSQGSNRLIQNGAKLVISARDILDELNILGSNAINKQRDTSILSDNQRKVYEQLVHEPLSVNMLVQKTGLSTPEISTCLTMLEMEDYIKEIGNGKYSI